MCVCVCVYMCMCCCLANLKKEIAPTSIFACVIAIPKLIHSFVLCNLFYWNMTILNIIFSVTYYLELCQIKIFFTIKSIIFYGNFY